MSMIFKCLPLFLILAHGVRANFIYHDSATASGGEFSASFPIGHLRNAGHDSPTDLENAALASQSYASSR